MRAANEQIKEGFREIHRACEEQGRVLGRSFPYRICIDSALKVSSVLFSVSPESAREKGIPKTEAHEAWLDRLGISTHTHGFEETEIEANAARLDLSNHPNGTEANCAYGRYTEGTASQVSIVLKKSLAQIPIVGLGVRRLNPIIVPRPSKKLPRREQARAFRQATIDTGQATLERIQAGGKVLTFIEGSRSDEGALLKFQKPLVEPAIDYLQSTEDAPSLLVVKTACINGPFPHKPEDMANPFKEATVYQAPMHYFRDVLDISGQTVDDILAEARAIMNRNLASGIELSLEEINA